MSWQLILPVSLQQKDQKKWGNMVSEEIEIFNQMNFYLHFIDCEEVGWVLHACTMIKSHFFGILISLYQSKKHSNFLVFGGASGLVIFLECLGMQRIAKYSTDFDSDKI